MFDNYPPGINPNHNSVNQPPVDMYAELNQNPANANNLPPTTAMPGQFSAGPALPNQPYAAASNSSFKFLIIGVVTLVVVLGGAFAVYQMILKPKLENNVQVVQEPVVDNTINEDPLMANQDIATSDTEIIYNDATSTATSTEILPSVATSSLVASTTPAEIIAQPVNIDSDNDGLNDDLETLKGTNKNVADTDGDGLNDGDEVLKYETDPLKADTDGDGLTDGDEILKYQTKPTIADTDGDGYNDGQEVKNGYNPLGAGRLVLPK